MAAGFDKQGEAVKELHQIGFSFVEIVFRLPEDNAVVNRYCFNSDIVWEHLKKLKETNFDGIIGVNLGKNKETKDTVQDYLDGIKRFMDVADYFVINISSPNTPSLRSLQNKKNLEELTRINAARELIGSKQPLLLKLAPDLSDLEQQDVADVILRKKSKVDGLIFIPIGVGSIFSGADAYVKIKAGASLVQLYTSYMFNGSPIVVKIKKELCKILETNGFSSVADAVGKDTKNR
ncbi:hypothetical protein ACFW04_014129 [Cataglyphis niger]